jgi:outer membrane immunogenic protein
MGASLARRQQIKIRVGIMRPLRAPYWLHSIALSAVACAVSAVSAQAGDLARFPSPGPTEASWSGFFLGVGGGVGSLNADVNAKASRTDSIGCGPNAVGCPPDSALREIDQGSSSSFSDMGGTGGFFTVQGGYDYQFAPRWVAGGFVDADWSDIGASAKQTSNSSISFFCDSGDCGDQPNGSFSTSSRTIQTKVSTDWNVSVGGRIGWLANPNTLLYFLAAYTHADLGDARVKVSIPDPSDAIGVILGGPPGSSPFPNSPTSLLVKLPDSLDGWSLGGGGEAKIGGPWSVKLEYRWTHLEGGSAHATSNKSQCCFVDPKLGDSPLFRDVGSSASANLDLDEQTVRGALVYHFWSGGYRG